MIKYPEINRNNQNIRCKLFCGNVREIKKVVLYGHGFAGHKESKTIEKFAERILSKYKGIAVLAFDLPCHGNDVKKKLKLQDCILYIDMVIEYIKEELHTDEIYSYATSFGGYLVLKYIAEHQNPFRKIVLRCPAVNMAEVLVRSTIKAEDYEEILKGKNVEAGFDRKIEIDPQFLKDLESSDIQKLDYTDYADDILILQGTKDEIVPMAAVEHFADENIIEFIPIENADHRFQDPNCMETATKAVTAFFVF